MSIFYLGKHRKRKVYPILQQIKMISYLSWLDIKWYCKWWKTFVSDIYHSLGDILSTAIDKLDLFYNKIIGKVSKCIALLYIITMINVRSSIIMNRIEIGKSSWINFLNPHVAWIGSKKTL